MYPILLHCLLLIVLGALSGTSTGQDLRPVDINSYTGVIKLACVGDSITQGVGAAKGKSWPDQIQAMLGERWQVRNFGVSGSTLLNSGDKPYQKEGAFKRALEFNPDVVVVILGTNDTKPQNWNNKGQFTADYQDLITKFAALPTKPRIFISYPPYIAGMGNFGITNEITRAEFPLIDAAAKQTHATIINVYDALEGKDQLIPDRVHPNSDGMTAIATVVYRSLVEKAPGMK